MDSIFVAIGRSPNLKKLFAPKIHKHMIERQGFTDDGYIAVNNRLETVIPNVYAVGDVIGGLPLANKATVEGYQAIDNMFSFTGNQYSKLIPMCIFSDPEIALLGLNTTENDEKIYIGKYRMLYNGRSVL